MGFGGIDCDGVMVLSASGDLCLFVCGCVSCFVFVFRSRVVMLYVPMIVNKVPVTAFVDSGAQSTIMSVECAQRCNLERLIDRRYAGMAVGVGTAKIIGKVHAAVLQVGTASLTCAFTILDNQGMDFLFGLDMLKKFQV